MFITSSKSFAAKRADGTLYRIPIGFVGEIPEDVAGSLIVQLALKEGSIKTPETKKDKDIDKALTESAEKAKEDQAAKEKKANAEEAPEEGTDAKADAEPEAEPEAKPAKKGKAKK